MTENERMKIEEKRKKKRTRVLQSTPKRAVKNFAQLIKDKEILKTQEYIDEQTNVYIELTSNIKNLPKAFIPTSIHFLSSLLFEIAESPIILNSSLLYYYF